MKPIQSSLNEWTKGSRLDNILEKAKRQVLHDPYVRTFLNENEEVTDEMIEQGLVKLYDFQKERTNCASCPGLVNCPNMMKGYVPELILSRGALDLHYRPCKLKIEEMKEREQRQLMKSLYVPTEVLQATFETLDHNEERSEAVQEALNFALRTAPGEDGQGLYFYGKFGVGKTYLMGAIMNALKVRDIDSFIVYTPDFFREMRQAIGDGTFQEKLETVKRAKVLILDDIGAETISAWARDDVLGAILQFRMLEKLPTLYTSNYDYDELEGHLAYSDKGGTEELKTLRIMERVRHFTTFVTINGENRRKRMNK